MRGAGDLFDDQRIEFGEGAVLLRGFARDEASLLLAGVEAVCAAAPFRHLRTPGGQAMSVAMTNCGEFGWISDNRGYRYSRVDPESGSPWPAMPEVFRVLAVRAASTAGYAGFMPDACLVNRYRPGARMSLHQDRDEQDFSAPIVSVSLGLPAVFLFGGQVRSDRPLRVPLAHGDVVVWGGPARLAHHGVMPLAGPALPGDHDQRINLTFRRSQ